MAALIGVVAPSLLCCPSLAIATSNILILQSHDTSPYRKMVEGFLAEIHHQGLAVEVSNLELQTAPASDIETALRSQKPNLIFSLGTPATRATLNAEPQIPVIAGLVLDIDNQRKNVTGISLDFPLSVHWQWLRRILPNAKRIAVIYDPAHANSLLNNLSIESQRENIELIPAPATSKEDLAELLQRLPSQLDAIWALDGVAAFNATTVKELLLYSFRNRTPLIGLSEQWVKAGAIYALDWDYADLGSQAAELALAILANGKTPSELSIQTPRKVRPVFNSKTAEHMKLNLPQRWLPEMTEVAP